MDKKEKRLEKAFELLEDDFKQLEGKGTMEDMERIIENVHNFLCRNNLRLRGHKEEVEAKDLKGYLENLFQRCLD